MIRNGNREKAMAQGFKINIGERKESFKRVHSENTIGVAIARLTELYEAVS